MLYTNNIYMPLIEEFHNLDNFIKYKKYYQDLGFNVNVVEYDKNFSINYYELINNLASTYEEEVFIVIDSLLLSKYSIYQSIELSKKYNSLIKPSNKTYFIEDYESIEKIINFLLTDEILDSFIYSDKNYNMWPMDGSWVFNKNTFNTVFDLNKKIDEPSVVGFDMCYKNSLCNGTIFIQSDSYKIKPSPVNLNKDVMDMYKNYLESFINLFNTPDNFYIYKNQVLEKIENDEIFNNIFNIEKFFSYHRYI